MSCVWGVDPSTKLIAIGMAYGSDKVRTTSFKLPQNGQYGERLSGFRRAIVPEIVVLRMYWPPACVWVEQPAGKFVAPVSQWTVGVLCEVLFEVLQVPVWLLMPDKWKTPVIHKGANKAEIAAWAKGQGIEFSNQDEADAAGVAVAGKMMYEARQFDL